MGTKINYDRDQKRRRGQGKRDTLRDLFGSANNPVDLLHDTGLSSKPVPRRRTGDTHLIIGVALEGYIFTRGGRGGKNRQFFVGLGLNKNIGFWFLCHR